MIKAIALDDEPPALNVLINFCNRVDFIDLQETFTKTEEALFVINNNPVDLLFLDINMPSISGIDFYKKLSSKTMVIFTTAYSEYAIEGFNVKAIDYLLKPFTFNRFAQAADKAKEYYDFYNKPQIKSKAEFLFLRVDYKLMKVRVDDIIFIEGLDDYLKIHLKQQKPLVIRLTMKAVLEKLDNPDFLRVHRSYIVSFTKIDSVRNKIISIGGEEIPIGSSYEAEFSSRFKE